MIHISQILIENPEGRQFERPRRKWEDNVKMDLMGGYVDLINLA
jgi:hypothetical protein